MRGSTIARTTALASERDCRKREPHVIPLLMRLYNFNLTMALYVFNMLESRSENFNWRKQRVVNDQKND